LKCGPKSGEDKEQIKEPEEYGTVTHQDGKARLVKDRPWSAELFAPE
jgi:hypothetical protein